MPRTGPFTALLFVAAVASSGGLATGQDEATARTALPPRPDAIAEVMLIGTFHFANPGADAFNLEADDVRSEKRQQEIVRLVERLAKWRPDLVMVEFPRARQKDLDERFAEYREGGLRDRRNEYAQVGMRLAHALDHGRLAAIDVTYEFQAPEHKVLFEDPTPRLQQLGAEMQQKGKAGIALMSERLAADSIGDVLAWMNSEPMLTGNHDFYVDNLVRGWRDESQGSAHTVANWYSRNILIFQNVLREVVESEGAARRVVVIIGQGHVPILRQLVRDTPWLDAVDPVPHLRDKR